MKDKFTVNFDNLSQTLLPQRSYRLADVQNRIEKVAYDLVRFRDNEDTEQLWKIQDGSDGPVIVALYGEDGGLAVESNNEKNDWDALPDKSAMHIYYKGEPLVSLSSSDMGIPETEFNIARRWLPKKLANDESLQKEIFSKVAGRSRELICQRFPELRKVADFNGIEAYEDHEIPQEAPNHNMDYDDAEVDSMVSELLNLYDEKQISRAKLEGVIKQLVANAANTNIKRGK